MSLDVSLYEDGEVVFDANITHNLGRMACFAGIYEALWLPEETGATKAADIIDVLRIGAARLAADPAYFDQFNAPNGWGLYEHFLPFVTNYLRACMQHPNATIEVSR